MKVIYRVFVAFLLLVINGQVANAEEPVMVIRFNQDFVNYERSLERVVKSALDIKESAFFDVIAVVPETESSRNNRKLKERSKYLTKQVVENMQLSGIAQENIRVTYQDSSVTDNSEVHIFVR